MILQPSAFYRTPSGQIQADKPPLDRYEFGFDFSELLANGAVIQATTWTAEDGLVLEAKRIDGAVSYCWISGGELDASYLVTCSVQLSDGRTESCTFTLLCVYREPSI